jgi:dolichol kinase
MDALRRLWPALGRWTERRIGGSLRPGEHRGWIWPVHYLTGVATLLAFLAPAAVAATAVAFVVVGDALAALVGRRYGKHRFGAKSLEGSLACWAGCMAMGSLFLPGRWLAITVASTVATLVEALPLPVDDNWSVPLVAAVVLVLLL